MAYITCALLIVFILTYLLLKHKVLKFDITNNKFIMLTKADTENNLKHIVVLMVAIAFLITYLASIVFVIGLLIYK